MFLLVNRSQLPAKKRQRARKGDIPKIDYPDSILFVFTYLVEELLNGKIGIFDKYHRVA